MTTRAATFSSKIRNLNDYYQRLITNCQPPSGIDVANTLRYFQQTLLGFLKDVSSASVEVFETQKMEQERLGLFPNLNYAGLYNAIVNIIDSYGTVNSVQIALGQAILSTLNCLYLFLDHDSLEYMPYTVASLLPNFPEQLHGEIMHCLCNVLLPFIMSRDDTDTTGKQSAADVMLLVFHYSSNPSKQMTVEQAIEYLTTSHPKTSLLHHTWLVETLMSLRRNVYKDIIYAIACGTSECRIPAANLLFYYWPTLGANVADRRTVQYRPQIWHTIPCQHKTCCGGENNLIEKKCLDPVLCSEVADSAPPVYLCGSCTDRILEANRAAAPSLFDVCKPMSMTNLCQNKMCSSQVRTVVATCFSIECRLANGLEPLKLCQICHDAKHGDGRHLFHSKLPSPWDCDKYTGVKFVEAVIRLLKECSFMADTEQEKRPRWLQQIEGEGGAESRRNSSLADEKRMLSRYGVWLLVGTCTPRSETSDDAIGRLLAMLFQWFGTTALLPNDSTGTALEHLKSDFICGWLPKIIKTHHNVFVNCLLPHPPEYARVGGHWDALSTHTEQLKEGLSRILALIPYDIIDFETWDRIMPHWLDAISTEVPDKDLPELKILLCKIFEIDMCALPFPPEQIYHFIETRLTTGDPQAQLQALDWLNCLSDVTIPIPSDTLLKLFSLSVKSLIEAYQSLTPKKRVSLIPRDSVGNQESLLFDDDIRPSSPVSPEDSPVFQETKHGEETPTGNSGNVPFFSTVLDIMSKQMDLMEFVNHVGVSDRLCQKILLTITEILRAPWTGAHVCDNPECDDFVDCILCRDTTVFYEILYDIVERICPKKPVKIEIPSDEEYERLFFSTAEEVDSATHDKDLTINDLTPGDRSLDRTLEMSVSSVLHHTTEQEGPKIFRATEQVETESIEFACILPTEEVETAIAEAMTLSETDVGLATCKVITATLIDEHDQKVQAPGSVSEMNFWHTSQGKFRFTLEELPAQLQLIHAMLLHIEDHPDPDVSYFILLCVKLLCLHAEALSNCIREHRGFLVWAQENILLTKFWKLLQAEYSHVSEACVPLILHCVTLPCGSDIFWRLVNDDFASEDWKIRFAAVEKITVIGRFLDQSQVKGTVAIQAALANAFCYLIGAVNDPVSMVAQRALLYLETIKASALKCLVGCLEVQFDAAIVDRPLIINRLYLLTSLLPNEPILFWDFFLQRFDVVSMEAQLKLEKTGEIAYPTDLMHTDPSSDLYQRKLTKARNALDQIDTVKSIVRSMERVLDYQKSVDMKQNATPKDYGVLAEKSPDGQEPPIPKVSRSSTAITLGVDSSALGKLKEFTDQESTFAMILNKAMDLENTERHTMYLLITLFMKFLSNPRTSIINPDEKAAAKKQSIVLRHLSLLLGYSTSEKCFTVPPYRLRSSAISNAFLAALPHVLDNNLMIGAQILPIAINFLQYLPSPQKYASDYQAPTYSLWYLEPLSRYSWLWSTLLVIYKYRFDQAPISDLMIILVQLCLATLESHDHQCHTIEASARSPMLPRSRVPSAIDEAAIAPAGTPATAGGSVTVVRERKTRLRRLLRKVLLLIRVVRHWPRGDDATTSYVAGIAQIGEESSVSSSSSSNGDAAVAAAEEEIGAFEIGLLPTPNVTPRHGANVAQRRRAAAHSKQPTFDERDELQHAEEITEQSVGFRHQRASISVAQDEILIGPDSFQVFQNSAPGRHVDSSIIEQISAFDKSFTGTPPSSSNHHHRGSRIRRQSPVLQSPQFEQIQPLEHRPSISAITVNRPTDLQHSESGESTSFSLGKAISVRTPVGEEEPASLCTASTSTDRQVEQLDTGSASSSVIDQAEIMDSPHTRVLAKISVVDTGATGFSRQFASTTKTPGVGVHETTTTDNSETWSATFTGSGQGRATVAMASISGEEMAQKSSLPDGFSMVNRVALGPQPVICEPPEETSSLADTVEEELSRLQLHVHQKTTHSKSVPLDRRPGGSGRRPSESQDAARASLKKEREKMWKPYEPPEVFWGSLRFAETTVVTRCLQCNAVLEFYDEDTISLCIITLSAFVRREPNMAAPYLLRIMETVSRNLFVPGNCRSVARQCIRVVLHQLAPNRLFYELFQCEIYEPNFFHTIANALTDFPELNPVMMLSILLENILEMWNPPQPLTQILENMADYVEQIPTDNFITTWSNAVGLLERFLTSYSTRVTDIRSDYTFLLRIIAALFKVQNFSAFKQCNPFLESTVKILTSALQTCRISLKELLRICAACNKAFPKDRDRQTLTRIAVTELVNALKFKSTLPVENYLTLIKLILQDIGELDLANDSDGEELLSYNTCAAECARPFLQDLIDFIGDLHVLHKTKDTLGGELKAGLAQYVAAELTRGIVRDSRTILRYLPWLYSPPPVTQQGPSEFVDCVAHLRLFSWLLLGSLLNTASPSCYPIPLDASHYVSDHIHFVLAGFAEQSKESVLHMSSLFHAFHLCQLWTAYCEQATDKFLVPEAQLQFNIVVDFWSRITPAVLQLLSHSKVLADMVNLHFLNTIEALLECRSGVLAKFYPMWQPVLMAYHAQIPSHLAVRLDACENQVPDYSTTSRDQIKTWLKRIKFKISQIELQSSAATQFYSV